MNQNITQTVKSWSFLQKCLFRFFFVFCIFTIVPLLSDLGWEQLINWSGHYFYNEQVAPHPSGSGDTLYDFYSLTVKLIASVIAAFIWSFLDRKRESYNTLLYWQEVYIRYYLALFLLVYGFMKVIKLQFGYPNLSALLIPLGYKSPMGLAWTFMGYSDTYTIFSGFCEVLAAAFLIYRKTKTLGALIGFGVMLNVFLMNMSYDIPVKLFSLQLALLSAFIVGLDYKRLLNLFILNRPALPQLSRQPFKQRWANITTQSVKIVAIIAGLGFTISKNLESRTLYGDAAPKPPMYGIYTAEEFIINNDTLEPKLGDTTRWKYLVMESENATIFNMKTTSYDDLKFYIAKTDTLKHEIKFLTYSDSMQIGKLHYQKTDSIHYNFEGIFDRAPIKMKTVRTDEKDFPLMNRGFHWVNEYPYNR